MSAAKPHFELRFLKRRIEPKAQTLVGGLRMVAPPLPNDRAALDLIACLDVSGSMAGEKIERAKESLRKLVDQLSAKDRLGIVTFSTHVNVAVQPTAMRPEAKDEARRAIDTLRATDLTNLSGGLEKSLELLTRSDGPGLKRVLLFTDGFANVGLSEGDLPGFTGLIQGAGAGTCVSFFGYGEDHNGDFLASLATIGNGNYHRVSSPDAILDAFGAELGGLLSVIASECNIRLRPLPGAGVPVFLNDFRTSSEGGSYTLHLPELYAEEERWVVFELPFAQPSSPLPAERELIEVEASWLQAGSGERQQITLRGSIELVDRAQVDTADPALLEQHTILLAAQAQRRADELMQAGRYEEAVEELRKAAEAAAALKTEKGRVLAEALREASDVYANPVVYAASLTQMRSLRTLMGKGKPTGSLFDAYFETGSQTLMRRRFRGEPPDSDGSEEN